MKQESPRRSEIIECALALAQREGFGALTVKRIAECVGFTEAALYRHFRGKAELMAAMLDWLGEKFIEPVRAISEDEGSSPESRLGAILARHFALVRTRGGLPIFILAEAAASRDPQLLARTRSIFLTYRGLVADLLGRAGAADRRRAEDLALAFIGAPAALAIGLRLTGDPDFGSGAEETIRPWLEGALFTANSPGGAATESSRTGEAPR
jgi:TetR/AcrR family transcriptional regulator